MFKLARRAVVFGALAVVVYAVGTFVQVWVAANRDLPRPSRPAAAIIVLGAAQYDGRPSPVLRARLDHAAALYRDGLAPVVVVTGGQTEDDPTRNTEASASADYLASEYGVPQDAIIRENHACNTWDSLASTANELRKRDWQQVILVSDPFHSARIAAIAGELGLSARVSPTRTSPIGGSEELRFMVRETLAVGAGRIVGFRRLMGFEALTRPGDCH